jgi:hypothetical protein
MQNNLPVDFDDFDEIDNDPISFKKAMKELTKQFNMLSVNCNELRKELKRTNDQRDSFDFLGWFMYFAFAGFILLFLSKICNRSIDKLTMRIVAVVDYGVNLFQESQRRALGGAFNAMPSIIDSMMNNSAAQSALGMHETYSIEGGNNGARVDEIGTDESEPELGGEQEKRPPSAKLRKSSSKHASKENLHESELD